MAKKRSPVEEPADSSASPPSRPEKRGFRMRSPQFVGLMLGFALCATAASLWFRTPDIPPAFLLKQALRYLDESRNQPARDIARRLADAHYQDPDFAGGVPFVLGIVAFREAADYDEESREERYVVAAASLREAERLALTPERRPEWAHALGVSLHRAGSADAALPLLEEAVQTCPAGRIEAALLLAETCLYLQTRESAEKALSVNAAVVEDKALAAADRDRAFLQRAQILLALGRREEAQEAVARVSREASGNQAGIVLRAQTLMADGKYRDALKLLKPVADDEGLDRTFPAEACYLTGLCWEKLDQAEPEKQDQLQNAIAAYERTVQRFERSHEALAARLGAADGLRKLGRNQEALEKYAEVLRSVRDPKAFRNRWMNLKKMREMILDAWNAWVESDFFNESIVLAESMSPVIPREQADELAARACRRWAEQLDDEVSKLPFAQQVRRGEQVKLRWNQSGYAYARLAETLNSSSAYAGALWTSAEDYTKGHDFGRAVEQLTKFIDLGTTALRPMGLVRRGQALMDQNRTDAALFDFRETISAYPTDPAAFQARYLIGQCHLERSELELAEKAWRKLLESPDLSPNALEWRKALFSLGKLLYYRADSASEPAAGVELPEGTPPAGAESKSQFALANANARFEETVAHMEEFLERYPDVAESTEARYLLAKALQRCADLPQEKLQEAETDNARAEFRRQIQEKLERAIGEFQHLQSELKAAQSAGSLDDLGQTMLRNSYLELARSYFFLGRYEDSIVVYTSAAGKYQQDSDSLAAYMQISNCYDRLKRPTEALSTLAQAQLILNKLPDTAFPATAGAMTREDWQRWIDRALRSHQ